MTEPLLRRQLSWLRVFAPVVSIAICGAALSVFAWHVMVSAEDRAFVSEFRGRANNQAVVLRNGIEELWTKLHAVRAFFESASRSITREEFERFSNALIAGDPAILNLAWVPRVTREQRAAHELEGLRDGIAGYRIRSVAADGSLPVAPERDEHFPKFYSTEDRASPVYGLDLNDDGTRSHTVNRIRDGNLLSISPPLTLYIGTGDRRGFWAGVPVYRQGFPLATVEERRRNFVGMVQGVFQIDIMVERIFGKVKSPVRFYLFTPETAPEAPALYAMSRLSSGPIAPKTRAEIEAGLHAAFPINLGDVQWKLLVAPEAAGLLSGGRERSTILLINGLLLTAAGSLLLGLTLRNSHKLRAANKKFEAQNLLFESALNNMMHGLLMFDRDGRLITFNRRFVELYRLPWDRWAAEAPGITIAQVAKFIKDATNESAANVDHLMRELQASLAKRETRKVIYERTDGRFFSASCAPMADGGFVLTFEDVTDYRRKEQEIFRLAHYDSLTDLPNRVLFHQKMEETLARTRRGGTIAVLSLDLDNFKSVNDTLGHPVGDKLLRAVATRILGCIRDTDIAARLGGDEFAVVQAEVSNPESTTALAARLIDAIGAPYEIDGHQVVVGASVGIALAPQDGATPGQLMKSADLALYRCKDNGGSTYRFFEAEMDARMQQRRALELDLRKALLNREFALEYQPLVKLKTGKVTSCEALLRWHHPQRGLLAPLTFIPIAEETGLIVPIGEWILQRACRDAADWPDDITVAVNISPVQFRSGKFVDIVSDALRNSGLPASRLELEVTELVLMDEGSGALDILHRLKALGVRIAMDDFGTGYSSLSYLRSFPFDKIKIDQSFIQDLPQEKDSLAILRAVVGLGRSLGIVTTAEGVETQAQLELLRKEGCTEAQGYLFSQSKPAAETKSMLETLSDKAVA